MRRWSSPTGWAPGTLEPAEALSAALAGAAETDQGGDVQVIADGAMAALVDRLRDAGAEPGEPRLDGIAATSVVGNWERELARFGPDLAVVRHHGGQRIDRVDDAGGASDGRPRTLAPREAADALGGGAVVITSYALVRRDAELFAGIDWDVVVLDEAQQVKDPASRSAQVERRLAARQRVALTGTPMENRLSELWSIVDFTNRGLLESPTGAKSRMRSRWSGGRPRRGRAAAADGVAVCHAPHKDRPGHRRRPARQTRSGRDHPPHSRAGHAVRRGGGRGVPRRRRRRAGRRRGRRSPRAGAGAADTAPSTRPWAGCSPATSATCSA